MMPVLQQRLQTHIVQFGYELIDTPLIEPASLFLTKAGDQIIEHLFSFERGGQQYALRPEFTASAAYQYIQQPKGIVRWQFAGSVFEDIQETASLGAELIGLAGSSADAEILGMAATGLTQLGIQDWKLVIGHVGLTRHLLQTFQLDDRTLRFLLNHRGHLKDPATGKKYVQERLERYLSMQHQVLALDMLESMGSEVLVDLMTGVMPENSGGSLGARTREDIARRLIAKRQRSVHHDQIIAALDFLTEWSAIEDQPQQAFDLLNLYVGTDAEAQAILQEWQTTVELLVAYDVPTENLHIRPDLARSWDYYTGIVFELQAVDGQTLIGGGRYDELTRLIGGQQNVPAVGFACYLDAVTRIAPAVSDHNPVVTIVGQPEYAIKWAQRLRQQGITVILESTATRSYQATAIDVDTLKLGNTEYSVTEMPALMRLLEAVNL
ncbi:MAG: ATP phosphoribosyltransferase regulatory subunit [Anaerolineae bacterium]|nr:ATP phosphoribosyltransferase regulatory subunit [Anaerolineae bacterium]